LTANSTAIELLGGLTAEQFLQEYWQKKPLIIRNAFPDFSSPVDPDDLAGFSLEHEVESRIIIEQQDNEHWILKSGPFDEDTFTPLSNLNWTLLIQQLDAWVPEINALKKHFNFIPDWRVDDVMASYAPKGGSVGPHFDYYDVFLVQAYGQRNWKLGQWCDEHSVTREDTPLKILTHFNTNEEWTLNPGDMLYVPPKLAHYGVAENDCITLSVGFRAPRQLELLSSFTDFLTDHACDSENPFFEDAQRPTQPDSSKIQEQDKHKLKQMLREALDQPEQFERWIGSYLSEPKNEQILFPLDHDYTDSTLLDELNEHSCLIKNEGSRFLYSEQGEHVRLFVDGAEFEFEKSVLAFVYYVCSEEELLSAHLLEFIDEHPVLDVITTLVQQGSLAFAIDS